jgi:hypothetical protein
LWGIPYAHQRDRSSNPGKGTNLGWTPLLAKQGMLSLVYNSAYRLELEWDNGRTGQVHEFPASVPVTIRW